MMAVHRAYLVFFYQPERPIATFQICRVRSYNEARELINAINSGWHVGYVRSRGFNDRTGQDG